MSVSYWNDKGHRYTASKDVVIIGGGIAGVSTAYWLNKLEPSLDIAILEKNRLGDGATGRNAGFITCGSVEHFNRLVTKHGEQEAKDIWNFSETNLKLLKEELSLKDDDKEIGFQHKGSFSLASTQNEFEELKRSSKIMESMGISVETLNDLEIEKRLGAVNFVGGIKYIDDATVNPKLLLNAIKQRFSNKVHIYENAEVFDISNDGDNKLVKSRRRYISAPIVIIATNGYSPLIHNYFDDKIFPTRGQILATEPVSHFMESACYANFVLDYFRQMPTGEMIIGGFRQLKKDTEKGYSDEVTDVIQEALEKFLHDHIPAVRKAKITHRWSGIMGFSVDGQPMVGSLPSDPNVFFLGGFTAHGLGLAFNCANNLAHSIMGTGEIPSFISARRF